MFAYYISSLLLSLGVSCVTLPVVSTAACQDSLTDALLIQQCIANSSICFTVLLGLLFIAIALALIYQENKKQTDESSWIFE
jgi:hypothetical protein